MFTSRTSQLTLSFSDGTLRWQSPEMMSGISRLTTEVDVYAFGISSAEVLNKGGLPWPHMDDDAVRHLVLSTLSYGILLHMLLTIEQTITRDHLSHSLGLFLQPSLLFSRLAGIAILSNDPRSHKSLPTLSSSVFILVRTWMRVLVLE